jgi:hypothetical protein
MSSTPSYICAHQPFPSKDRLINQRVSHPIYSREGQFQRGKQATIKDQKKKKLEHKWPLKTKIDEQKFEVGD